MSSPYEKALKAINDAHAQDPRRTTVNGEEIPYELHYANQMTHYLDQRSPDASSTLKLAIRAQHFRRWEIRRDSYPMTRPGYFAWRTFLKKHQAEQAQQICLEAGLLEKDAESVASLIRKENLKKNEETQILEDVACLVFLDDQFEEFQKDYDEDKIINILRKTWVKMSEEGHNLALKIPMSDQAKNLIGKALSS